MRKSYLILLLVAILLSCDGPAERQVYSSDRSGVLQTPTAQPTFTPIEVDLSELSPDELCNKIGEIKKIPYRDPEDSDPLYEAIISRGSKVVPCLVKQITNESPAADPREAPSWEHYKVGDTAVFLLVNISKNDELLKEMLPAEFQKEWKTNGVYAYFNYVSDPDNRKSLQDWWINRMKKSSKKN